MNQISSDTLHVSDNTINTLKEDLNDNNIKDDALSVISDYYDKYVKRKSVTKSYYEQDQMCETQL